MKIRELLPRLHLLLKKFESALTRVEDQGQRIENGVDRMIEMVSGTEEQHGRGGLVGMVTGLSDTLHEVRAHIKSREDDSTREMTLLKNRLSVLEKHLGPEKEKRH